VVTASRLAVRFNQDQEPYDNVNVRRALQMAVDNETVLELGYNDRGEVAENHHVCPIHPEYAEMEPPEFDPDRAAEMIAEEGLADHEFELISIDDLAGGDLRQRRRADPRRRHQHPRTILPGATFWNDWLNYPFSSTEWNMRPLGVQVLNLAYRSGVAWNESGYANPEFDALWTRPTGSRCRRAPRGDARAAADAARRWGADPALLAFALPQRAPDVHGAEMHPTFEVRYQYYWKP
jgi:peptide/nickel transport system substrate-binding protein